MQSTTRWTRQQLLIALKLYNEIPFEKFDSRNPVILEHAELIGRSPSALAMKLSNLASLDPDIRKTGRIGLVNSSSADREIWQEMEQDWLALMREIEQTDKEYRKADKSDKQPLVYMEEVVREEGYWAEDRVAEVNIRIGQYYFRKAVLSAYNSKCCISGLAVPQLLVASHIAPWKDDVNNRLNPRNGLSLSALHDKAFDRGLITISEDYRVVVSKRYREESDSFFQSSLTHYHGKEILLPEKFAPAEELLDYHRQYIFERSIDESAI